MKRKSRGSRGEFQYSITLQWSDEDEAYIALVPEFPYASAFGDTPEQAVMEMKIAVGMFLEALAEEGRTPPEPRKIQPYSGELRVRFPRELHGRLALLAEREGMSLNSYIVYLLARATATYQTDAESRAMVGHKRKSNGRRRLARTA